jgi:hypothetical protein
MRTINEIITDTAKQYIGQKELKGNSGFTDPVFWDKMSMVGFDLGEAWCALFTELVWKEAYQQYDATRFAELDKLFSDSATKTFKNFKAALWEVDQIAERGALIIWQYYDNGKPTWKGHAGIVKMLSNELIYTIEGNTNVAGSREGEQVAEKIRKYSFAPVQKGLVLLGFIHPKE